MTTPQEQQHQAYAAVYGPERSLGAYLKQLRALLAAVVPFDSIIIAPEIPTELVKPTLLLRMSTAVPAHQDSASISFQALLYWDQPATTQLVLDGDPNIDEEIGGMDVAFQIYSQITRYELASEVNLQAGVVSEADGYVDYVVSWNDRIENDYRLRDPEPVHHPIGSITVNYPDDTFYFHSPAPTSNSEA